VDQRAKKEIKEKLAKPAGPVIRANKVFKASPVLLDRRDHKENVESLVL
jgi:hypothetical protein